MIDRLKNHTTEFFQVADTIKRHCSKFAGKDIEFLPQCNSFVWDTIARQFSKADDAATAYNFDCVCKAENYRIPCIAEISVDGKVRFIPKH